MPSIYDTPIPAYGYSHSDVTAITPNDSTPGNIVGARWLRFTDEGTVTFKRADGTNSPAIPFFAGQTYEPAAAFVNINAAGTTVGVILAFWAVGVTPVAQS